jgi:hypothetical protein
LEIRLTGTKLAARPSQSLVSFADELADPLDAPVLDDDPRSVRNALAGAYHLLSPAAAHLFGRLGRYPGSSLCLQTTAAEAGISVRRLRQLFDELIALHLVVEDGPDRYRFHDIVCRFARQCAAELVEWDAVDEWMRQRVADSYRI